MEIINTYDVSGFLTNIRVENFEIEVKSHHSVMMSGTSDNYEKE